MPIKISFSLSSKFVGFNSFVATCVFVCVVLWGSLASCQVTSRYQCRVPKKGSGVTGTIRYIDGNLMPSVAPAGKNNQGAVVGKQAVGVVRKVYAFRPIKIAELQSINTSNQDAEVQDGALFRMPDETIYGKPLATARSDFKGHFVLKLPPGKYTILIAERNGIFAPPTNENGIVGFLNVVANKYSTFDVLINYLATY